MESEPQNKNELFELIKSCPDFTAEDRAFHEAQITTGETDLTKIQFYIKAAQKRTEIVKNSPEEKKEFVFKKVNELLDQSSGGNRENTKGKSLETMQQSIDQFLANQKLVKEKTKRLQYLPAGFEQKIWKRFMERFENETSGDILNPVLTANFKKSIDTTFSHLIRTLELQEQLKKRMSNEEKYFWLRNDKSKKSKKDRLSEMLSTRLDQWVNQDKSLKNWSVEFAELVEKQTPKGIKNFNENYTQVFTPEFWQTFPKANPMDFPNFTAEFNFKTEKDFLTKLSLGDLKKFPKKLKKAIQNDANEILADFFSDKEKSEYSSELKKCSEKNPKDLLSFLFKLKNKQRINKNQAQKEITQAKRLYLARNPRAAESEIQSLEKKFGKNILENLGEKKFKNTLELRLLRINELEKNIKSEKNKKKKLSLQKQLDELSEGSICYIDTKSANERKEKITNLKKDFEAQMKNGNLKGAKATAQRMRSFDVIQAQKLLNQVKQEMAKKEDGDEQKDSEKAPDSMEKQAKIEFLERSIEHAEKVKEACDQIGIPKDDPAFWGPEGVKNRVQWLKNHGLYSTYQKFNASDPNMPANTQNGGFRFRWMDSRGDNLTGNNATDGKKYLTRYKESGYILAALGGVFSVNWKSASSPTYTPDKFITKVQEQLGKIKGKGIKEKKAA